MFSNVIEPRREALKNRFVELREGSVERAREVRETGLSTARELRATGEIRWWTFEIQTLEALEGVFGKVPEVPGLNRVWEPVFRALKTRLEEVTSMPISDYDSLSAKRAAKALRPLDRIELLRVQRYEVANKNRKTVLDGIERAFTRLNGPRLEPTA